MKRHAPFLRIRKSYGVVTTCGGPFGLAMSPDGAVVYAGVTTGAGSGLIQVVDVATRTLAQTITSCGGIPKRVSFAFSGGLAVIADDLGCVNFIE